MKVAVHDTALGENAVATNDDLFHTTEPSRTHHHVIADYNPRVRAMRPRRRSCTNDDVVAENHLAWTSNAQTAKNPEVGTGAKANSTQSIVAFVPVAAQQR